jgi:type II secretory pathway pseudopilin PulG
MIITMIVGLAVIAGVIFTRQSMELDKQRLAALNYCRQAIEAAQTNASIDAGVKTLVPFNAPGLEIEANVNVSFYPIRNNGTVDWANPTPAALSGKISLCRVKVTWRPPGRASRLQTLSMSSIVRAGTT